MAIRAQRIIVRFGMSQEIPALDVAEMGWDIDLHRLRVGDGSNSPVIIMGNKSLGPYEYNFIDYVQFPEIRMLPEGTVDGVDISDLNAANGFVVRRGNNLWAHRALTNTDTHIVITNPLGTAGNPIINLSQEIVENIFDALHFVSVDDITIHGNGRPESPLYAHTANDTEKGVVELATNEETQAGVDASRAVTPAGLSSRTALETRTGLAAIATQDNTNAGFGDNTIVTPQKLHNRTATFVRTGIIRKATWAEVEAGVDTDTVVVPAYLKEYVDKYGGGGGGYVIAGSISADNAGFRNFAQWDAIFLTRQVGDAGSSFFGSLSLPSGGSGGEVANGVVAMAWRGRDGKWYAPIQSVVYDAYGGAACVAVASGDMVNCRSENGVYTCKYVPGVRRTGL